MTHITSSKDVDNLTLTFVAEFAASPERIWQVWADPRQLERWWGPPTWPATFVTFDFVPGGRASYYLTGPEGERSSGWWRIESIDEPRRLAFADGFADADGAPVEDPAPTHSEVSLEPTAEGSRMTIVSRFDSLEQLEHYVEMGVIEGFTASLSQIEDLIAA